jgi:hypothetical protein
VIETALEAPMIHLTKASPKRALTAIEKAMRGSSFTRIEKFLFDGVLRSDTLNIETREWSDGQRPSDCGVGSTAGYFQVRAADSSQHVEELDIAPALRYPAPNSTPLTHLHRDDPPAEGEPGKDDPASVRDLQRSIVLRRVLMVDHRTLIQLCEFESIDHIMNGTNSQSCQRIRNPFCWEE